MLWIFSDGGRKEAGYKGDVRDCACRSIAIATGKPYQEIYKGLNDLSKSMHKKSSARDGMNKDVIRKFMELEGWEWVPTMFIGKGCKVHLTDGELPTGRLIVSVSKHITAVIDSVIHDDHDPQRASGRCVYGYWKYC